MIRQLHDKRERKSVKRVLHQDRKGSVDLSKIRSLAFKKKKYSHSKLTVFQESP